MSDFHIALHARGQDVRHGDTVLVNDHPIRPLSVVSSSAIASFRISFEEACERFAQLPRMFVEPDGSFVWTGQDGSGSWQIEGTLFDRQDRLFYVELWGTCPPQRFASLLNMLDWPEITIMYQLVREAIFLDEADFCRLHGMPPHA